MSGTIDSYVTTSVTLGSVNYPTPLTITAYGNVSPGNDNAPGIYVPGALNGVLLNDGLVVGGQNQFYQGSDGIDLAASSTLALDGTGYVFGGNGGNELVYGAASFMPIGYRAFQGGAGVSLGSGAALTNDANTIEGGNGGNAPTGGYYAGNGITYGIAGAGGDGVVLGGYARAQNAGQIIGGGGGYGAYGGGAGGIGVVLDEGASFGNQGIVAGGYGGGSANKSANGGDGADLYDGSTLSNSGLIIGGAAANSGVGESAGGAGLRFVGGGTATNATSGTIAGGTGGDDFNSLVGAFDATGGTGVIFSAYFTYGSDGHVTATSSIGNFINDGLVIGGTGGTYGVYGGEGGFGMALLGPVSFDNDGTVSGGAGASAGNYGGNGGTGMVAFSGSSLTNDGLVVGGTGGAGRNYGGSGGDGLYLFSETASATNEGTIAGGDGTVGSAVSGGGGTGAEVLAGRLINDRLITGGKGANVNPSSGIDAGNGGTGALVGSGFSDTGGMLINHGTITGGAGGTAGSHSYPGPGGAGAIIQGGTLFTDGRIIGGMGTVQADAVTFTTLGGELILGAGAVFSGLVEGSGGTGDTLALGGTVAGTLSGIGTEFLAFDTLDFLPGVDWTAEGSGAALAGNIVIDGFSTGDVLIVDGFSATSQTYSPGIGLELSDGTVTVRLDIEGAFSTSSFIVTDIGAGTEIQLTCFLAGTRILTPKGEIPVEALREGDIVATLENGEAVQRPVVWVGHRHVRLGKDAPEDGYPVRIRAGAFDENLPRRDLLVTAEHCLLADGHLIPARMLVNGGSVFVDRTIPVYTYYHVELERHGILLAEGLPTESYLDTGNRGNFANAAVPNLRPDFALNAAHKSWEQDAAAPLAVDRATVEPVWRALRDRAVTLGMLSAMPKQNLTTDSELRLITDNGAEIKPVLVNGAMHSFALPAGTGPVRLCSRTARPADVVGRFVDDRRQLGVAVGRINLWAGRGRAVLINEHLTSDLDGWHALEPGGCRWTAGNAALRLEGALPKDRPSLLQIEIVQAGPYLAKPRAPEAIAA
jgi:hypothetical protein